MNNAKKLQSSALSSLKKIPQVQAVILFGSTARGKRKPYSDVDLAVFLNPITKESEAEAGSVSSTLIDTSLFHRLNPLAQYKIMAEGKVLFERKKGFVSSERTRALHRFFDTLPLYRRFGLA